MAEANLVARMLRDPPPSDLRDRSANVCQLTVFIIAPFFPPLAAALTSA